MFRVAPSQVQVVRKLVFVVLALAYVTACIYPHLLRLRHPSLFCDDVVRIELQRTLPLSERLFRPFNEHVAPAFELVTWATWAIAGKRLTHAPLTFTLASLLPFVLCLAVLGILVWQESGSRVAALSAMAMLSISALYVEVAWWYSASTFTWALLATLLAWLFARLARVNGGWKWWLGSVMASALAPACSAIGFLAAPVAALRAFTEPECPNLRRSRWLPLVPLLGVAFYFGVCAPFRVHGVLAQGVQASSNRWLGIVAALRAPVDVLIPRMVGIRDLDLRMPRGLDLLAFLVLLVVVLAWSLRSRLRPVILGGVFLVLGGYSLIYPFRHTEGAHSLLQVQRYHLFPQVGLILVVSSWLGPRLRRLDDSLIAAAAVPTGLALLFLTIHWSPLKGQARYLRFPEQTATLAALERLEAFCKPLGVTRSQALAALDPLQPRWFPFPELNALAMLGPGASQSRLPQPLVRSALLSALSPTEREAICGGMDASRYVSAAHDPSTLELVAEARPTAMFRVHQASAGLLVGEGGSAFREFEFPASADRGSRLRLPIGVSEVWWTDSDGRWTESRSAHWPADLLGGAQVPVLALDSLPHCRPEDVRGIRLFYKNAGPIAVESPRLLR
jgi:hypothetical protein